MRKVVRMVTRSDWCTTTLAYHFVRQTIELGITKVIYIPNKLQVANPLTKGVLKLKLDWFKETINLLSPS